MSVNIPRDRIKPNGKIDMWDLGPQVAPKAPPAPDEPDAKLKGSELAAAQVEYEDQVEIWKSALRTYSAARKDHLAWAETKGGPVKVELWGVDARHALELQPDRYKLDLPKGVKPGKAQAEAEEMAAVEAEEIRQARAKDPMHSGAMQ